MAVTRIQTQIKSIQPVLKIEYYCDECEDFHISSNISNEGIVTVSCANSFSCQKVARKVEDAIDGGKRPETKRITLKELRGE